MDGVISGGASSKPVSVVSIPDSQPDEELAPLIGEKRKRDVDDDEDAAYQKPESKGKGATAGKKTKKAKTAGGTVDKTKKKGLAKKAKGRTVVSEDEEDGAGGEASVPAVVPETDASKTPPPAAQTNLDAADEVPPILKIKIPKRKPTAKKTVVSESEGEGDDNPFQNKPDENSPPRPSSKSQVENTFDGRSPTSPAAKNPEETPKTRFPSLSSRYTIAGRTKSTPLSELIAKVSARPGSPFPPAMPRSRTSSLGGGSGTPSTSTYSPFNKFSRSALSRIAPLHPNRRTPPPPLPPPPPKPKTKKEKEREERWEEEMIEAVGGWDEWKLLSEEEQKAAKRVKWARELEGWED
ncbi:hypothetical protein B0H17DRAFT_1032983 [Mycena rosella]|uniref:Uncharacterized protein n=1 Tax=Mycena rosella TaxID=1033263 RepID=A0AAD7GXK3_MYCRO|nr:hypothetical protein B0H17DRAFT_1032983 [Mycena rosella]